MFWSKFEPDRSNVWLCRIMKKNIYLTVIIPCYNEFENIKRNVLAEVNGFLSKKDFRWEVIISDDESTDGSANLVKEKIAGFKGFRLISNPHGGKPSALWYGLKESKGEYVLFTDMDQSTPIRELDKLLIETKNKYCAVIGSRGLGRKNFALYRKIGSAVFLAVRRSLILPEISDTQCGFKLFNRNVILKAFPKLEFFSVKQRTSGWRVTSYDVELLHIIKKMNCNIKEVLVEWHDQDISKAKGGGLARYLRESIEMFSQIIRVKINDIRNYY